MFAEADVAKQVVGCQLHVLILDGHPDRDRLITHLLDHYEASIVGVSAIQRLAVRDLAFDPNLRCGARWPVCTAYTSRPLGRPVSESLLARGRPTNPARIPVSPTGCRY